jgi:hypothetical protein
MNHRERLPYRTLFRLGPWFLANTVMSFRFWVGKTTSQGDAIVWGRR